MTVLRRLSIFGRASDEDARVTNGGLDMNVQDQSTRALDLKFIMGTGGATTLAAPTAVDSLMLTLTDATGFTVGTYIGVFNPNGQFLFATQISPPSEDAVAIDSPIDQIYPAGSTVVAFTTNMAVDGSLTPQIFQVGPSGASGQYLDITRFLGTFVDGAAMDDGKFGSIALLTLGCVLRVSNGLSQNYWNVKTNGEISELCGGDFNYIPASPAGDYGARFRMSYAGQEKHGVVIRLGQGESIQLIIQDDLTGIDSFTMMAQGHVVE